MGESIRAFALIGLSFLLFTGCGTPRPRYRAGCLAADVANVHFSNPDSLGRHNYTLPLGENNGIVYTCRGGHIDLAHLRIGADYVAFMYGKMHKYLESRKESFTFKLNTDKSVFHVSIRYPQELESLAPQARDEVINTAAIELAEYASWKMVSWHEILTWFGYRTLGFIPEYGSALSWEDNYSNLLGILLGSEAIRGPGSNFNENMTVLIEREFKLLGVQPKRVAIAASDSVRGRWYDGYIFADTKLRNVDLGLENGFITPLLVPGICDASPQPYPIPRLDKLESLGFKVEVSIAPHEWESRAILRVAADEHNPSRVDPEEGLKIILEHIKAESIKRGERITP